MARRRPFVRDAHGIVAVEFALLLPLMALFLLGSVTATRMVRASLKFWNAAQTMADLVAQQTIVTTAQISDFCTGATLTLAPIGGAMTATVASVTNTTPLTRILDWQDTSCGNGATMSNPVALATPYTPNLLDSVIVVKATYAYTLPSSYILPASVTFTRTIFARPRNSATVIHG